MAIDPRYIADLSLQQYLVDKDSGLPLAGGKVFFYRDASRTEFKDVYKLAGDPPNYSFVPLDNPVILSAVGTFQDADGNDIIPYYLPLFIDAQDNITDIPDLYYVVVESFSGVSQFTREGWPPNSEEGGGGDVILGNISNYIPNGQFLTHNNYWNNTTSQVLDSGSTIIAPGGWTFELPDDVQSTNILTFTEIPTWTGNPPESPPFQVTIQCTEPNSADDIKSLRIKFNDVNIFSSNTQYYTFGFSGVSNSTNVDVIINLVKYFGEGGTAFVPAPITTFTLEAGNQQFFSTPLIFEDNAGDTFGTGQTYVAIDISFSRSISFNVSMTDFVLVQGNTTLEDYPVQTNADTLARAVTGWMNKPDYNGQDLYLPLILTRGGMEFDHGQIGNIVAYDGPVGNPSSALTDTPPPITNYMPADGSSYLFDDFSTLGIPYSRYGDFLLATSPIFYIPRYGTGADFVTPYAFPSSTTDMRLTVNSNGSGISGATDGNTGWSFVEGVNYNGSSTGSVSINYTAYSNVADTILCVGNFQPPAERSPTAGTTSFTVNELNFQTGLEAQQFYAFTVLCTNAASLIEGSGQPGKYFGFGDATVDFYIWFNVTGEVDPVPGGYTFGIECNLTSTPTAAAQDVANVVREIMNAYQITMINITNTVTTGQYWLFSANPASPVNYYVWYNVNGAGGNPNIGGRIGIEVPVLGFYTTADIRHVTLVALGSYQFAAPDLRGMFPRGADFTGIYDLDVAQRWSSISGISGANYGTFEFQQFLDHFHWLANTDAFSGTEAPLAIDNYLVPTLTGSGETSYDLDGSDTIASIGLSGNSGGTETRPVNFYVNWCVKY